MITVRNVHKEFGNQTLFENASIQINDGDRYALVGPNGAGKSTFFKMLLGQEQPDKGEVQIRWGAAVGYLPQEQATFSEEATVLSEALSMCDNPDARTTAKAKSVLMGLGFKVEGFDKKVSTLSGGWAMRVAIARILMQEPDLLLLDEPTNHLDLDSLFWFQEYLQNYPGAIFMISHDRSFVNAICQAMVSVQEQTLRVYKGSYENFIATRQAEREKLESAYRQQQLEIEELQEFIDRNRARASTAARAQSAIKRLEKIEKIELPEEVKKVRIRFPQPQRAGVRILTLNNIYKSYGPVKVYQGLDFHIERGWKMAFAGHNGAGKSTLLKILAGVVDIDSGERQLGLNAKVGYFSQHRTEMLNSNKTVYEEVFSVAKIGHTESFIRTVLATFLFRNDSINKKVSVLSGGEKSRLALVKLLMDPPNVLLLDEPTTHLDMASVEALIDALKEFDGTVCFISHDLYFINELATHVVHVDNGKVSLYPGNYEYFQSRQASIKAESEGISVVPKTLNTYVKKDAKEERRQRAQEREKARDKEKLEKDIVELKAKIEALSKQYEDPAVYGDPARVKALSEETRLLQEELQNKEKSRNS